MNADFRQAGNVKSDCYGRSWDGDLLSGYQNETALKVAEAQTMSNDGRKSIVNAVMDVSVDSGNQYKVKQTFLLEFENGRWKINEIKFESQATVHNFFRQIVERCNAPASAGDRGGAASRQYAPNAVSEQVVRQPLPSVSAKADRVKLEFSCNWDSYRQGELKIVLYAHPIPSSANQRFYLNESEYFLNGTITRDSGGAIVSITAEGSYRGEKKVVSLELRQSTEDGVLFFQGPLHGPDTTVERLCYARVFDANADAASQASSPPPQNSEIKISSGELASADQTKTGDGQRNFIVDENLTLVGQCRFTTHNQFPSIGLDKRFDNDCNKMRIITYKGKEHRMSVYIYNNVGIKSRRLDGFMFYDPLLKHNGIMVQSVTAFDADFQYRVEPGNGSCLFTVSNRVITYAGCELRYQVGDKVIDQNTDSIAFSPAQQTRD